MKLYHFPIVKIVLFYMLGIIFSHYIKFDYAIVILLLAVSIISLYCTYLYSNKQLFQNYSFGISVFVTFFFLGSFNYHIHQEKNHKNHYTQYLSSNTQNTIQIRLKKQLKASKEYERYEILIEKFNHRNASGTVLLYVKKDTTNLVLNIGNSFLLHTIFHTIKPPLNPYQFDYANYLAKKNIYHQTYVNKNQLTPIEKNEASIYYQIVRFRKQVQKSLVKNGFNEEETSIINALLLGQRHTISEEVYSNYINAGAVHILAISGLHIGIITLLLSYVLSPLSYIKNGLLIKAIIILILLWAFAFISGLSPSIVRAVTMFSFITLGLHRKKKINTYITLITSAFLILLIQPNFLFDVGFQLSYTAVLSIVWIQPLLYNCWIPKSKAIKYIWQLFSVSLAAQIGIAPISLFYFHQFPGLFFLSNLIIIPFLGFLLMFGIITITLGLLNIAPSIMITIYRFSIHSMNDFIAWIAKQESFVWKEIYFDWKLLFLLYLAIVCSVLYFKNKHIKKLKIVLISILCIQLCLLYNKFNLSQIHRFSVFHMPRNTLISHQKRDSLIVYINEQKIDLEKSAMISNYKTAMQIKNTKKMSLKNIFQLGKKKVLIIDSLGVYDIPNLNINYVILTNTPKINLARLIDNYKPELIIADGTNYKNTIELWKTTCKKRKLPFHYTGEKGAFILDF